MDWHEKVPKVQLHLHLEGSIPHEALWELIQKYGGDTLTPNLETLKQRFAYRDFPHFIEVWSWQKGYLREYDDFSFVSEAVATDLLHQNHRYVELMFSPSLFQSLGLKTQELVEAVKKGLARVEGLAVNLIADLVRDYGPKRESRILAELSETRAMGVIGIGIGGSEHAYPPEPFAGLYDEARRIGFHTMAHAGEAAGVASIWGAIQSLEVERIGHGTRAVEDPTLVDYLVERKVPLDMCPLSNLRTGVVKSLRDHPIRDLFERGGLVSVNTDDPKMFGNSLAEEFRLLEEKLHFSRSDIRRLTGNAIQACWLPHDEKQKLARTVLSAPLWESV